VKGNANSQPVQLVQTNVGGKSLVYFLSGVLLPDTVAELGGAEVFSDGPQGSGAAGYPSAWPWITLAFVALPALTLALHGW
jgi:hypothetical protein